MTTREAFESLINKPLWWVRALEKASQAATIKRNYKRGRLSIEKMENILQKSGCKVVQEKLWSIE